MKARTLWLAFSLFLLTALVGAVSAASGPAGPAPNPQGQEGGELGVTAPALSPTGGSLFHWDLPLLAGYWDLHMLPDGLGGVYVAWSSGTGNVPAEYPPYEGRTYAQRYDSAGNRLWVHAPGLWGTDDLLLSDSKRREGVLALLDDGAGGAIVIWIVDDGFDGTYADIRAQRLNPAGQQLWQAGGVPVVTDATYMDWPWAVSDGQGGIVVTWSRCQDPNTATQCQVSAQRILADGTRAWAAGGVLLSFVLDNKELWICWVQSDHQGGAYVVWEEERQGNILAKVQHVDQDGQVRWAGDAHDFPLSFQAGMQVDGSKVIGLDSYPFHEIELYGFDLDKGTADWGPLVVETDSSGYWPAGRLWPDGQGSAFVSWIGEAEGSSPYLWEAQLQHIDALGQLQWDQPAPLGAGYGAAPEVVPGDEGGAYAAWTGEPSTTDDYGLRVQQVDAEGQVLWFEGGVLVSAEVNSPRLESDGAGGAFLAWTTGPDYWWIGHEQDYPFYLQRGFTDAFDPKDIWLTALYVDDGIYQIPPVFALPLEINKAPGDKLELTIGILNAESTTQHASLTVTLPTNADWVLDGCSLRTQSSGQGDQPLACTLTDDQCHVELADFPANAARYVVMRFQLPADAAPGTATISADLGLERGYPAQLSHREVAFRIVRRAPAMIVTNRQLLYDKYPDEQITSLLQELSIVARGRDRGTQAAVIYYADRYDEAIADWDNTAIDYTHPLSVNEVADIVDAHIVTWCQRFTPTYLLIVGGDEIIPLYRVDDTPLANEEKDMPKYRNTYNLNQPAFTAIRKNYFLSDAPYADTDGEDWLTGEVELATGRIVGTDAGEMSAFLDRGLVGPTGTISGVVASTAGYDVDFVTQTLTSRGIAVPLTETIERATWTRADLTMALDWGAAFFAEGMHNDYDQIVCPDTSLTTGHVLALSPTIEANRVFVGLGGCHAGLVADDNGVPNPSDNNVWAWVRREASGVLGSTALVYGSFKYGAARSGEWWFNTFYRNLRDTAGGKQTFRPVGQAWRLANVNYNPGVTWDALEKRAVVQFVLYGVPWMAPAAPAAATAGLSPRSPAPPGFDVASARPIAVAPHAYATTVEFTVSDYDTVTDGSYELVTIPETEMIFHDLKPILPKLYGPTLYLPPGGSVTSIDVTAGSSTSLGAHHLPMAQSSPTIDPRPAYTDTTDVVGVYPDPFFGYDLSIFADHIKVTPFIIAVQHDPQTQETTLWETVTLEIGYQAPVPAAIVGFSTDKAEYGQGEAIQVTAAVANMGTSDLIDLTAILSAEDAFGQVEGLPATLSFDVAAGEVQQISTSYGWPLGDGTYSLRLEIVDGTTLLATSRRYVRISSGQVVSLLAPDAIVGWPPVILTISYQNLSTAAQNVVGTVGIYNHWGEQVADLGAGPVSVAAGQTCEIELDWDPRDMSAGEYTAVALVQADGQQYGPKSRRMTIFLSRTHLPLIMKNGGP